MKGLISILLSALLLVSTSGLTYARHFCGGHEMMAKITMGKAHLSCGMVMETDPCDESKDKEHHCCNNEYMAVDTDDNFVLTTYNLPSVDIEWALIPEVAVLPSIETIQPKRDTSKRFHPPPLIRDLQILYETFLI